MESRVLPSAEIASILSSKFICVKVDADSPGKAEKVLSQVKGNVLPFYAFLTPDGKFISGTSGFRDTGVFKGDLEGVLKSDSLKVPPDLEKKLAKMAEQAAKDVEAKKVQPVVKAAKEADAIRGNSDSKDKIRDLLAQLLEAGQARIKEAAEQCKEGKFDEAAAILSALTKDYKGTDLERPLAAATKALDRIKSAAKESEGTGKAQAKRLYEQVVKECKEAPAFVEIAEAKLKE